MLSIRRKSLIGLDIDASAVRMIQLRRDSSGYSVVKAAIIDIAPWGGDPELRNVHTVQAILQGLASGFTTKFAVCGLRGPEVVVRDFEFPALTPEEIEGAVELEVSQICPFLAEESTLDYQVTSSDGKRTRGFWVAATNGLIENTRQLVSQAGLHCALVDVAGLALLNLLHSGNTGPVPENPGQTPADGDSSLRPSSPALRDAVLNLGDSCTTVAIADPAGRPFVRDIARTELARNRPVALAGRSGTHGSVSMEEGWIARSDHRSTTDDSLVDDVSTTLRYYAVQNGSARVDRLLVCSGSADADQAEDSASLLRGRLSIEVEPWNPMSQMRYEPGQDWEPLLHESGGSLAVAAGLAMRAV
jgi:type IV pilus assembly protein PilM